MAQALCYLPLRAGIYKSCLNSLIVSPASFTIPAIVKASTGLALGMVIILSPFVIVICLPSLAIRKPAF